MDMRRGPAFLLRELILPALPGTYQDLLAAASGADLIIAGEIVFAAPMVAEKLRLPWVSALLSPFSFYSAYDPPVSPYAPSLAFLHGDQLAVQSSFHRIKPACAPQLVGAGLPSAPRTGPAPGGRSAL